ncbi:MAG: hypothetical protein GWN54_07265, partial [Gammaproteobacteria bacterium]|nr:hypothetical protein [Gammaproteobacteria bacterium]
MWILLAVVLVALVWLAWRQYAPPSPVPAELPPEAAIATDNAQQPGEAAAGSAAAEKPQAAQGLAAAQAPQG